MEFKVKPTTAYLVPARITLQLPRPSYQDSIFNQQLGQGNANVVTTELTIDEANALIAQLSKAVVEAQK